MAVGARSITVTFIGLSQIRRTMARMICRFVVQSASLSSFLQVARNFRQGGGEIVARSNAVETPSGECGVKVLDPEAIPPDLFEQPARLDLYDLVTDGKLNQIAVRAEIELPHNVGAVRVHCLHAEV